MAEVSGSTRERFWAFEIVTSLAGPRQIFQRGEPAPLHVPQAVAAVKVGLEARLVRQLAEQLDLRLEDLASPLHLTVRTLHRRLEQGRLTLDESERLLGLVKIVALAKETLGSK